MISKFVKVGNRIEIQTINRKNPDEKKVYISKIYDILSEDRMEITMPMEQTKLILLPVDGEYELIIYADNCLYQCIVRIVDRYKSNNVYILAVELTSNLRKHQRREYYRFSCALEMASRNLVQEEIVALEKQDVYELQPGLPLRRSVIVDISGGGLRFMSNQRYEPNSLIVCCYDLIGVNGRKKYEIVSKVLAVRELQNKPGTFEHRVQYHIIDKATREEIIKYIFDEERKGQKAKKNM